MKVLVACEFSGRVREAFRLVGHDAWSCDIVPDVEGSVFHLQCDVRDVIYSGEWDLMIAHPPCTYLTCTGNKWFKPEYADRFPDRVQQREDAAAFFMELVGAPIERIAVENPVGVMSSRYRKADQYIQPFWFGEPYTKRTGLWLRNLPPLQPTDVVEPQFYVYESNGKRDPLWHMETSNLPKEERERARSLTPQGIADAMASQWGG